MDTQKHNLLYLDSNEEYCKNFKADFAYFYQVHTAQNTTDALNILKQKNIMLLIVDQNMPNMTGIQFIESIKNEFPNIIRMLVSNSKDPNILIEAINAGQIFRYISKPWDNKELQQSIDLAIKIYQLEKKNRDNIKKMQLESLKMERILNTFRKYVPGLVLDEISIKTQPMFGGEIRYVTVLFATIDGLSTIIKTIDPPQILHYLNQYFSFISDCIVEHRGTIDKFIGGSILAVFGAPMSDINSEKSAAFCAVALQRQLKIFNEEFSTILGHETRMNIGINAGDVVIGNIGSLQYLSYTAIGSTVNIASRIMDLGKNFPNSILASESVVKNLQNTFTIDFLGNKEIRGKDEPIPVYKIIDNNELKPTID